MQSNKITLYLRKSVKRQPREKVFHIKTQKNSTQFVIQAQGPLDAEQKAIIKQTDHERSTKKMRHTSVIARQQPTIYAQLRQKERVSHYQQQIKREREFPQIYNPTISSGKIIISKKSNQKMTKYSPPKLVQRKIESQSISQKPKTQFRKHDSTSFQRNIKLTQLQPIKQMSKQKKQQMYHVIRNQFHQLINSSNHLSVINHDKSFKAYIQKGNNGILVKQILKKRWWWHIEQDKTKANLIWTQWFDKTATADLRNITIGEEPPIIDEYITKQQDQNEIDNKKVVIKKIVDSQTYTRVQNRISIRSNTYFKIPKGNFGLTESLKKVSADDTFKVIDVNTEQLVHNHVQGCLNLHSKKLLFMNFHKFMTQKQWNAFDYIPLTFYIQSRDSPMIQDLFHKFELFQKQRELNKEIKNIWICKPGENSNRGCGIKVVKSKHQIANQINSRLPENNAHRSVIIQKYIQKCFLIQNRKFDIRCYILLTTANGILKGYWYKDGYIRTSSVEYSLQDTANQMIHLTNDAVQKKGEQFGKHEDRNKLSFEYFKLYLKKIGNNPKKFDQTYQKMKLIAYYLISSVTKKIKRKQYTFELFGLDFMLDENLNPLLIQANSNPCLENNGKILGKLIHELVQNVFMTAIDPIFPPPMDQVNKKKKIQDNLNKDYFESNKFELIFTNKDKIASSSKNENKCELFRGEQQVNNKQ